MGTFLRHNVVLLMLLMCIGRMETQMPVMRMLVTTVTQIMILMTPW